MGAPPRLAVRPYCNHATLKVVDPGPGFNLKELEQLISRVLPIAFSSQMAARKPRCSDQIFSLAMLFCSSRQLFLYKVWIIPLKYITESMFWVSELMNCHCVVLLFFRVVIFQTVELLHCEKKNSVMLDGGPKGSLTRLISRGVSDQSCFIRVKDVPPGPGPHKGRKMLFSAGS